MVVTSFIDIAVVLYTGLILCIVSNILITVLDVFSHLHTPIITQGPIKSLWKSISADAL